MPWTLRSSRLVVTLFAAALPLKVGGCGRTACITVTPSQLQGGACPAPAAAQPRFASENCQGLTVLGNGVLDDELCCYPVEAQNSGFNCFEGDGSIASAGVAVGAGGAGGAMFEVTCNDALNGAPFTKVTGSSAADLMSLEMCACQGACLMTCDPTLCIGNAPDNGCLSCLLSHCPSQLQACQES
jgi:hypothetical protein